MNDLTFAIRQLLKNPGFAVVAILTLALGIGVNTAIFSLFNSIALRPLPVPEPERVVNLHQSFSGVVEREVRGSTRSAFSYPEFAAHRDSKSFEEMAAYVGRSLILDGPDPERIRGTLVSGSYFSILRAKTEAGRGFDGQEAEGKDALPVAVLGHGFWQRRFGGDETIVGKTISLNRSLFTVVGVAAREFTGTEATVPDVWVPLTTENLLAPESDYLAADNRGWLRIVGRLKAGVSLKQAEAELQVGASRLDQQYPGRITRLMVVPGSFLNDPTQTPKLLFVGGSMLIVVALVLMLACANVANLLLARAVGRHKEIAMRLSLGARRSRLIRMLLVESLVLALLGGIVGVLLSTWILGASLPMLASAIGKDPSALALNVSVDGKVLGIALLVSLVATLAVGLVPALRATGLNLATAIKDQGSVFGLSISRSRLRNALVVVQVAISLVLLVGASLIVRSLQKAQSIELGYAIKDVIAVTFDLATRSHDSTSVSLRNRQFAERAQTMSGVRTVMIAASAPLSGYNQTTVAAEGKELLPDQSGPIADYNEVSGNYFEGLGIPILHGRAFREDETRTGAPVAVISQSLAHRLWPEQNPLGRRFSKAADQSRYEVIGVVKDVVNSSDLARIGTPFFYLPLNFESRPEVTFLVRGELGSGAVMPAFREIARELDSNALFSARRLEDHLERSLAPARMGAALASMVGVLALVLAMMGVYGLASFAVSQQTREFGIRLALGAQCSEVIRLVLRRGLRQVALGFAVGLPFCLAGAPVLSSILVGLPPIDPIAFLGVSLLLGGMAAVACYLPARRAAKVDPMKALRYE